MQNGRIYSFDDFELDAANRQLRRNDKPVSLPARAFDLLRTLVENNGRLVEKDELFSSVWRDQIVEESNLTVHISQIRKALGETRKNPRFIETVSGFGYRFIGAVSDTEDEELVIETETLARITIERDEMTDAETLGRVDTKIAASSASPRPRISASPFPRVSASQKVAVGAFAVVAMIGGIFWLSSRYQNNGAIAPVVLGGERQTQIRRLTSHGTVNHAVLSPDGKFFAYTLGETGSFRSSLWLGQTNGSSDVLLLPTTDLTYNPRSFSADGSSIYYTATEPRGFDSGTLYRMPVLGGVPQKLVQNINVYAVLSPDEKQIASIRDNKENKTQALVIANLDGSGEREIAVRQPGQSFFGFSLAWSPDSTLVAFAAANGAGKGCEIFAANVAERSVKQITALEWIGIARLGWLNDGSGLLATARDKNSFADGQIWQIDYESGEPHKIMSDLQHYASTLSLSADSKALVAVQSTSESHIWLAPAENPGDARQITFGSVGLEGWYGIDWTADGKIVYSRRVDQSLTIWTTDALGRNATQLTSAGFFDTKPSATADGKYIIFQSNRSGAMEIWRMNADGSDLRQLTFDGNNIIPHSTPDGRTVIYTHNANGINSLWRVSIDGGEATQIVEASCSNARVSPDGKFIACGHGVDGKAKLAIVPITGGAPIKLFDVPPTYNFDAGSIRWTRDGKRVGYRDWKNGIWLQLIDGGEPKRLEGLPVEKLYPFEWSPDGKQLAFTRGRVVRDVVLITDFR